MGTRSCTKGHSSCLGKRSKRALNPVASAQVPCWARPRLSESKVLGPPQPHPPPSITSSPSHISNKVSKISRQVSRAPAQAPAEMPKAMRSPTTHLLPHPHPPAASGGSQRSSGTFQRRLKSKPPSQPTCPIASHFFTVQVGSRVTSSLKIAASSRESCGGIR